MKRKTAEPPRPPRVPGVRYVKTVVHDTEARTYDGETTYRQVPRVVWVPAPPRDWDALVARALVCAAVVGTVLSLGWSTDSIGRLLDRTGSTTTAYTVAIIFDVVWLACVARQWLERDDPERANGARRAGNLFLVVAMAAIFANGYETGETIAGIGGAAVSGLAKVLWVLALGYYAVDLDEGAAYDLRHHRQGIAKRLALRASRRRLAAAEAYERQVYGQAGDMDVQVTRFEAPAPVPGVPAPSPVVPPVPSPVSLPPVPAPTAAPAPAPAVSPVSPQVTPAVAAPVPPVSSPAGDTVVHLGGTPSPAVPLAPEAPASAPAAAPAPAPAPAASVRHLPVAGGQQTKTGFIRDALAADPDIELDELTDKVRAQFGDKPNLRKDVGRLRRRILEEAS